MIYSSLDSSRQDESNDSKIIPIGAIFAEIAIFAKFQVRSGRINCLTRPEFSGQVRSGTRISGQKCGALVSGHYHGTIMALSWILKSHVLKIGQNYGIVSAEIKRKFTALPDTIFFYHILGSRKATK